MPENFRRRASQEATVADTQLPPFMAGVAPLARGAIKVVDKKINLSEDRLSVFDHCRWLGVQGEGVEARY